MITEELRKAADSWWIAYQRWSADTLCGQSFNHDGQSQDALEDAKHAMLEAAGLDYRDAFDDRARFLAAAEFVRRMERQEPLIDALLAGQSAVRRPLTPWRTAILSCALLVGVGACSAPASAEVERVTISAGVTAMSIVVSGAYDRLDVDVSSRALTGKPAIRDRSGALHTMTVSDHGAHVTIQTPASGWSYTILQSDRLDTMPLGTNPETLAGEARKSTMTYTKHGGIVIRGMSYDDALRAGYLRCRRGQRVISYDTCKAYRPAIRWTRHVQPRRRQ